MMELAPLEQYDNQIAALKAQIAQLWPALMKIGEITEAIASDLGSNFLAEINNHPDADLLLLGEDVKVWANYYQENANLDQNLSNFDKWGKKITGFFTKFVSSTLKQIPTESIDKLGQKQLTLNPPKRRVVPSKLEGESKIFKTPVCSSTLTGGYLDLDWTPERTQILREIFGSEKTEEILAVASTFVEEGRSLSAEQVWSFLGQRELFCLEAFNPESKVILKNIQKLDKNAQNIEIQRVLARILDLSILYSDWQLIDKKLKPSPKKLQDLRTTIEEADIFLRFDLFNLLQTDEKYHNRSNCLIPPIKNRLENKMYRENRRLQEQIDELRAMMDNIATQKSSSVIAEEESRVVST